MTKAEGDHLGTGNHPWEPAQATQVSSDPTANADGLTADFVRALPGGKLDDSEYEAIETALDRADAPCQAADGRWLTLAERVAALPLPDTSRHVDGAGRPCTCHPDERPTPCQRKYALTDCLAALPLTETSGRVDGSSVADSAGAGPAGPGMPPTLPVDGG